MALTLTLTKPGESAQKLSLNLSKNEIFRVTLSWDERGSEKTDIDLHAIVGVNTGQGAKASALDDILSAYNVRRKIGGQETGILDRKADGTFEIHNGALVHSPDALDGLQDGDDEWIRIDPSKLTRPDAGHIEIPLIALIHNAQSTRRFRNVANAQVVVTNSSGKEMLRATLSDQFGDFAGVQMGSIIIEPNGVAVFHAVGVGFNGDFNTVLETFS
jgi:tellurium resistance protein TerD